MSHEDWLAALKGEFMRFFTGAMRGTLIGIAAMSIAAGSITRGYAQPANAEVNAEGVNGWNVIRATFDGGLFQQTSTGQWTEFGNSGQNFYFEERSRDAWSVYLHDVSRDMSLQIDIYRQMISYGYGDAPRQDLYQITSSTPGTVSSNRLAASGINGFNVIRANYDGGLFQLSGGGDWIEVTDDGRTYRFSETQRDEWSAYMYDASRDIHIQIDIYRQMITIADGSEPRRDLYQITSARSR
jgi:hypothetical protein